MQKKPEYSMMSPMSETTKYILLQRTNYMTLPKYPLVNKLSIATLAAIEAMVRPEASIVSMYLKDMENEYDALKTVLPARAEKILDIGCGLAGIDVFLYRHYGSPRIYLLDKTGQSKDLHYNLEAEASYYNSLQLARELLEKHEVRARDIHEIDIDKVPFPNEKFDVIISLLSWGFHYPVSTYLEKVKTALTPDGVLVIDVRKSSDGEKVLRENFSKVRSLELDKKTSRLVCMH
jgi:SAM-dependent methyltransferase